MANNRISVLIDVTVDKANRALTNFRTSVNEADGAVGKLKAGAGSAFASLKANAVPAAAAAGAALFKLGSDAVDAASSLEQSVGGVEKAFGDAAEAVLAIGRNADESMGLSQRAFNEGALALSAFAEDIARDTGDPIEKVIQDLMVRAADFAAAYGTTVPDAVRIFSSTLSGESEPIKRYGIIINETETKAYAAEQGIEDMGKATQRAGLLMQDTSKFAGQFADEGDTLAGSQERLKAKIENLQAAMGEELLPVVADAVGGLGDLLDVWNALADSPPVQMLLRVSGDDSFLGFLNKVAGPLAGAEYSIRKIADTIDDVNNINWTGPAGQVENFSTVIGGAVDPAEKYAKALGESTKATEDAAKSAEELEQQHKDNVAALEEIVKAQDAARQATEDARMATLESLDASLNYRNQLADTAAEMANVVEVTNDGKSSAEEIAQAHRDAEGAAMAQADAAVELARSQAEMEGATLTAGQELLIYRDELAKLKDSATGDVAIAIQMMIDEIDRMRTDVDSEGIGTEIGAGVAAGIWGQEGAITGALLGSIRKAKEATRRENFIMSPSRLFADEVGKPIAQGVAEGIEEDAEKIGDALEKAIRDATEDAIDAAQDLVDAANDTLDGLWGGIDDDRSLEDMADSVAEAQANLAKVMADGESSTDDIKRAQERLEDASYRLLKATQDNIGGTDEQRDAWMNLAAQAGLTVDEIDKLVDAYHRLAKARAEAAAAEAAINAEAANAQRIRTDFGKFVSEGLVRQDQVSAVGNLSKTPGAQIALMEKIMLAIIATFPKKHAGGIVPGPLGTEVPIMAQAGERVLTPMQSAGVGMSPADMERAVANGMIAGWKRVQQMGRAS